MNWFLAFIFIFSMILIHELGHFSVARFFGVYIEVFSIGFGKKLISFKKFNTTWQISAIPLGGYVKMKGQDDTNPLLVNKDSDSYSSKKPWQRILILLAGPFANFIFAFFLLFSMNYFGKVQAPVIGELITGSPAEKVLKVNDRILSINGVKMREWKDVTNTIKTSDAKLVFEIKRNNKIEKVEITPKIMENKNVFNQKVFIPMVGIKSSQTRDFINLGLVESASKAGTQTVESSVILLQYVEKLVTTEIPSSEIGGVVRISSITANAASISWEQLFIISALISINLGVFNLLPIPSLDGGHIIFNVYEWIRGKAPSEKVFYYLTVTGWGLVLALAFLGLYNDISSLVD